MKKLSYPLNLQLFADESFEDTGVEVVPAAEEQATVVEPSGVDDTGAADQHNSSDKAFAKRLSEARGKWEQETADKYKNHDDFRKAAEYLQKTSGFSDIITLREEIELAELQEQADKQNVPVDVMKRLQFLETKAAKADELEQMQTEERGRTEFESNLKQFADGKMLGDKALDHTELWNYMYQNQTSSPEIAYKAMKSDVLEQQIANAEKTGVKKFLQAKGSIPHITGNTSQGSIPQEAPKTFAEARARAMSRNTFTE